MVERQSLPTIERPEAQAPRVTKSVWLSASCESCRGATAGPSQPSSGTLRPPLSCTLLACTLCAKITKAKGRDARGQDAARTPPLDSAPLGHKAFDAIDATPLCRAPILPARK